MEAWKMSSFQCVVGLCLLFLKSWTFCCQELSYKDITKLNASCTPRDTCLERPEYMDNLLSRNCECGEYCKIHGTCCIDSKYCAPVNKDTLRAHDCRQVNRYSGYYFLITKCDANWRVMRTGVRRRIRHLCEMEIDFKVNDSLSDPFLSVPVTSITTNRSYKNYFCAVCNDDTTNPTFWNIVIIMPQKYDENYNYIPVDEEKLLSNLVYDENIQSWGSLVQNPTSNSPDFESVTITFQPPNTTEAARACIPMLVSDCDPAWKNETVRRKCHSYMAKVFNTPSGEFAESVVYRNIHCLICNFDEYVNPDLCTYWGGGSGSMSFSVLLDVNPADGENVGRVNRCKGGESYDPFFKKCRAVVCALPGYALVDGKCQKT